MYPLKLNLFILLLVCGLVVAGCTSFGPPETCGDTIGGTADTVKFDQYFSRMALVNQDGVTGPDGENGLQFTATDMLDIRADTKSEIAVRACIQSMSGAKSVAFDQTQTIAQGSGGLSLGAFEPGIYVVRVIVEGVLVKNFPFEIK